MNIKPVNNEIEIVKQSKSPSRFGFIVASAKMIQRGIERTVQGVRDMPDLERPVAESASLPENANWFASTASMWMWFWRCLEYKCEPLRKGWCAWIRIFLGGILCAGVPMIMLLGLLWGGYCLVLELSDTTVKAIQLTGWMMLLCVCLVVLAVLLYVVYAVIMILRGKPIRVPDIKLTNTHTNVIDVESD